MMERRRHVRLDLKPRELLGVGPCGQRKDFQGDKPPEGDLHGLVDDTHAAATDLSNQLKLAKNAGACTAGVNKVAGRSERLDHAQDG